MKLSAGLLMFRRSGGGLEVLLVHPGGPFYRKKDAGVWSVPKGVAGAEENLLARAKIEFEEELGLAVDEAAAKQPIEWIELDRIQQKGGKIVHAWAFEGNLPEDFEIVSNTFELEWPPRSGRKQEFPEIDRAEFFSIEAAKAKMNPAQIPFLERLMDSVGNR